MSGHNQLAAGVIRVRLTGHPGDAAALAAVLAAAPGVEILTGPDGPHPNRRPPGHRLYLTVRLNPPPTTGTETGTAEPTTKGRQP